MEGEAKGVAVPLIDEAVNPAPAETEATKKLPETSGVFAGLALDHAHLGIAVREPCDDPKVRGRVSCLFLHADKKKTGR
jgi:hypothetical protein